mmetsp:Transcript_21105/g.49131  ORF Transcript_21105/g.49131 Transcript_21105/m.49131 type:complete len:213 (-) Transcript_21105:31-669(-)
MSKALLLPSNTFTAAPESRSNTPCTPTPGKLRNFLTSVTALDLCASAMHPKAFDTIAAAMGCADFISRAAAICKASFCCHAAQLICCTSTTHISPLVSVPVLSKATVLMAGRRSTVSGPLIRTPREAAAAIAHVVASGAPITIAHGQAVSKSTIARWRDSSKLPPMKNGSMDVPSAINRTSGVQILANLPIIIWRAVRFACASSTFASISDK